MYACARLCVCVRVCVPAPLCPARCCVGSQPAGRVYRPRDAFPGRQKELCGGENASSSSTFRSHLVDFATAFTALVTTATTPRHPRCHSSQASGHTLCTARGASNPTLGVPCSCRETPLICPGAVVYVFIQSLARIPPGLGPWAGEGATRDP